MSTMAYVVFQATHHPILSNWLNILRYLNYKRNFYCL